MRRPALSLWSALPKELFKAQMKNVEVNRKQSKDVTNVTQVFKCL